MAKYIIITLIATLLQTAGWAAEEQQILRDIHALNNVIQEEAWEMKFITVQEQIPQLQAMVFKNSPELSARINASREKRVLTTDHLHLKLIERGVSYGRVRTTLQNGDEYAGLVIAVVDNGTTSRTWIYSPGNIAEILLGPAKPVMDTRENRPGVSIRPEELPWGYVMSTLDHAFGGFANGFGNARKTMQKNAEEVSFAVEKEGWEHEITFAKQASYFVPVRISGKTQDDIRYEATVTYSGVDVRGTLFPFPAEVISRKLLKVAGEYQAYISNRKVVIEAKVLPRGSFREALDLEKSPALSPGDLLRMRAAAAAK